MKPIVVDLPYPDSEGIERDIWSATIISPAYAGLYGEMKAVLQYRFHGLYFESYLNTETAAILSGISIAEMKHFDILGGLILKLGLPPVYTTIIPGNRVFSAEKVIYGKDPQNMLMDDINGELAAIAEYDRIIGELRNERVSAIIKRIKLDEELHVKILREQLNKIIDKIHDKS